MEAQREMPKYKSHKHVWALKIAKVLPAAGGLAARENEETDGGLIIYPADKGYGPFRVEPEYKHKHNPQAGGYYVVYADGYKSFSPAEAFEGGYTRIN